jgi:aminopeptidase N
MGWDTFCEGIKIYFQRHKWTNTTLPDFIRALQEGYDKCTTGGTLNLTSWAKDWIQSKGSNRIVAEYSEQNG